MQIVQVALVDDSVLESEENFQGLLTLPPGDSRVVIGASIATATVQDNDCKCRSCSNCSFTSKSACIYVKFLPFHLH